MNTWKKVAALLLALVLVLSMASCSTVQSVMGSIGGKQNPSTAGNKPAGSNSAQEDPSVAGNKPAGDHSGDTDPGQGQGGPGQSGTAASSVTWSLEGGTLTISGNGDMRKIVYANGYVERDNEWPWHDQRNSITSVVVENGIISIGNQAFAGCGNLSSITIADSVTTIGNSAFARCDSLISVTIPNSVVGTLDNTFGLCSNLKEATIGTGVEALKGTFINCPAMESVTIQGRNTQDQGMLYCADPATNNAQKANITIYAPAGSPIEEACKVQGYNFSPLN